MPRPLSQEEEFYRTGSMGRTPDFEAYSSEDPEPESKCQQIVKDYKKDFSDFKVLMWRNWVVRKRSIIYTVVELIVPCVFFLLMYFLLDKKSKENTTALRSDEYNRLLEDISGPSILMFCPVSQFTEELIGQVGNKLHLKRTWSMPAGKNYSMVYYGYSDDIKPLIYYLAKWREGAAIVEFRGIRNDDIWPDRLNYTLKMKHKMKDIGEVDDYGPFMRIQWAIDSSYIQMKSENSNETGLRSSQYLPQVALSEDPNEVMRQKIKESYFTALCLFLLLVCIFSCLPTYCELFKKLSEERGSGVQELVKQVGVSYTVMLNAHGCNIIPMGLVYSIVGVVVITVAKWLPQTNMFLMFLALELNFHSVCTYAILFSFIMRDDQNAVLNSIGFYLLPVVPLQYIMGVAMEKYILVLLGLLPHMPMLWFLQEVKILETRGNGLSFKDIFKAHTKYSLSVAEAYLAMCIQIVLILHISYYLNEVRPGIYGSAKSWFYIFKKKEVVSKIALEEVEAEKINRDPMYFEKTKLTNVGIHIENVTKIFNTHLALSKVTFNVYHGEITVLLGHNGAGKTTLLSIISGALLLTKGRILVHGYDIATNRTKTQRMIGTCTQHNLFFKDLTVKEHVMLFAMLRGQSYAESENTSEVLLNNLGLKEKVSSKGDELSGGMKRRLQLGCALAGNCIVLILDEPTSGLDVETRRELWTLLLSLRGDRTVLLTTHFMEEADALGDRVVAMHSGRVRCHATPMYLKKNIGAGYRLTLTTVKDIPEEKAITETIQNVIPNATLKEVSLHSVSYKLSSQDSRLFPDMFSALEAKKSELGIESIGVGATSLEEVFMKLCSDTDTEFTEENVDTKLSAHSPTPPTNPSVEATQQNADRSEGAHYHPVTILSASSSFRGSLQILIPTLVYVVITIAMVKMQKDSNAPPPVPTALSLDVEHVRTMERAVLLNSTEPDLKEAARRLFRSENVTLFEFTNKVHDVFFRASEQKTNFTKNYLGFELREGLAKVFYTTAYREAAPVALNFLSNVLAYKRSGENDTARSITTNYELIPFDEELLSSQLPGIKNPTDIKTSVLIMLFLVYNLISTITGGGTTLPTLERETGTRHIHLMSGVAPFLHWLTTWLCHLVLYTVVQFPMGLIFCLFDITSTFDQLPFLGSLILVYLMASMAFFFQCYRGTFSNTKTSNEAQFVCYNIAGLYAAYVYLMSKDSAYYNFAKSCYYMIPSTTAGVAASRAANVARLNAFCNNNLDKCPTELVTIFQLPSNETEGFDANKCCSEEKGTVCYLCIDEFGIGKELLILAAQTVVYAILVIITQYGIFSVMHDRLINRGYKPEPDTSTDKNVKMERNYVSEKMVTRDPELDVRDSGPDAMLVNDIHKRFTEMSYLKGCTGPIAVNGISFSTKKGECFGLLGVNGAGKSTTFKMITAEMVATWGSIYANGVFLKWPRSGKYLQSLSYCPQFFGLDDFETGFNNLKTLLIMRGLHPADARKEADSWMEVVGLSPYRDKKVESYSGGCERRLSTAAALSSGAAITLLDEPTAGVDVAARRRVWVALKKGLRQNRSVIITSHSMDEMEALCDRIMIMANAKIAAIGSAPILRANYAVGHSLYIKVSGASGEDLERLKALVQTTFNCTLVDERPSMLQYHINVKMRYSDLFYALENLKGTFEPNIIEDYSVSETTLEEVFLSFAKKSETEEDKKHK